MLETIYNVLSLTDIILALICLVFVSEAGEEKKSSTVLSIKVRVVISLIFCEIVYAQIIISIILEKDIFAILGSIIFLMLGILSIGLNIFAQRDAKE